MLGPAGGWRGSVASRGELRMAGTQGEGEGRREGRGKVGSRSSVLIPAVELREVWGSQYPNIGVATMMWLMLPRL